VALFLTKNNTIFKREGQALSIDDGLVYENAEIGKLVKKDTDGDGVLDWEEGLWGTDPTSKDTDGDGEADDKEIAKLKAEAVGSTSVASAESAKLTETEKFSDQLFATVTALNESGGADQAILDKIGESLAENIQNSTPKKVYTLSDIKIIDDSSLESIQKYRNTFISIYAAVKVKKGIMEVLQEYNSNEDDTSILLQLEPLVNQLNIIINGLKKMSVPRSISFLHLDLMNALQQISENTNDVRLIDKDPIVALTALGQYEKNIPVLELTTNKIVNAIK